ncbi:DEAD/DEAH box helicase [Bdellovibrio bacteriovorus]|uniref:DEAD/DEAH box helicase n=1 Tax=Bdellovibrio bacteriovorus TaxID=959 RepID=UPI003AA7FDCC
MFNELCEKICQNEKFQNEFLEIKRLHLGSHLGLKENVGTEKSEIFERLLTVSTHFAMSDNPTHKSLALSIITYYQNYKQQNQSLKIYDKLATVTLTRLGNFPALQYFFGSQEIDQLDFSLWTESQSKKMQNTVHSFDSKYLFTDFQNSLWTHLNRLKERSAFTVSAPTSAGKSFALKVFLTDLFKKNQDSWFIYIVPSRALITQVLEEFQADLRGKIAQKFMITSAPVSKSELGDEIKGGLYVLTPERLQALLDNESDLDVTAVVIDEAQTIGDESRGILLQWTLEKLKLRCPQIKCIFACPFVENPEVFERTLSYKEVSNPILERTSPVTQNLIYADLTESKLKFRFKFDKKEQTIGEMSLDSSEIDLINQSNEDAPKIAVLAHVVGGEHSSIIYGSSPKKCEDITKNLLHLLKEQGVTPSEDPDLKDFSKFLKENIHTRYLLAESILYGVAFHYGNLPAIVRRTIEELFERGKIRHLICTSTLLQGVNLPARNLFMINPTKGNGTSLSIPEFWNLAGRAGRLGKEFEGNIYLLNYSDWNEPLAEDIQLQVVVPAYKNNLDKKYSEIIKFMGNNQHVSGNKEGVENTFMKVFSDYKDGNNQSFLPELSSERQSELLASIQVIDQKISIPSELFSKNPSVSVLCQQTLYDLLTVGIIDRETASSYIPPHPLAYSFPKNMEFFTRMHDVFLQGRANLLKYFAYNSTGWMCGKPISSMISNRVKHFEDKGQEFDINETVRWVFERIEKDLRFTYVKFSKCYYDILCWVFDEKNFGDLKESIPTIPLYLEFGASSKNMIQLISIGLSRTTAALLDPHLPKPDMPKVELENWLVGRKWLGINLPLICVREIKRVMG